VGRDARNGVGVPAKLSWRVWLERLALWLVRFRCGRMELRDYRDEVHLLKRLFQRNFKLLFNLWPPLLGAGIRITRVQPDWKEVDVEMKLRRWNKNYVGTHYGGSLYSMTDPFYMVMFIEILGRDYIVWDKSAMIRFRKPGRGTVHAHFRVTEEQVAEIREALNIEEKIDREFRVDVKSGDGEIIAEVKKLLQFRKKKSV
jgi:hypothetical protein